MQASNGAPYPRWTQEMLDQFSASVAMAIATSNERMTRFEDGLSRLEQSQPASNELMDRLERNLDRLEETVQETES